MSKKLIPIEYKELLENRDQVEDLKTALSQGAL